MSNLILRFSFFLILILGVAFSIHLFVLDYKCLPLFGNKIVLSYTVNGILAFCIVLILFLLRKKFQSQLGFLFLVGSGLKFLLFFLLFYPEYRADGLMSRGEFLTFFVPYGLSLILETFVLSKILNKLDSTSIE